MARYQKIEKFALWRAGETCELIKLIFAEVASYFGQELRDEDLASKASFKEAVYLWAKAMGLTPMAFKEDRSSFNVPIIARDIRLDQPVVMLPEGGTYLVKSREKSYRISASKVSRLFDEHILLFPMLNQEQPARRFASSWQLWMLAFLSMIFFIYSFTASVAVLVSERPYYLAALSLLSLGFFILIGRIGYLMSTEDYGLSLFSRLERFFRRLLNLPHDIFEQQSIAQIESFYQAIKKACRDYFSHRFALALSLCSSLTGVVLCLWLVPSLVPFLLAGYALILSFAWYLKSQEERVLLGAKTCRLDLLTTLEQYQMSFWAINELRATKAFQTKIIKEQRSLVAYELRLSAIKFWKKGGRFYAPLCLFLVFSLWRAFFSEKLGLFEVSWLSVAVILLGLMIAIFAENLFRAKGKELFTWPQELGGTHVEPVHIRGSFELINLSFSYSEASNLIFKNCHLELKSEHFYAISGASGVGKSTFLKLLLGFLQPISGQVVIDGQDLRSLNLTSLRKNFGVIFDDSSLFMGSVYDNIMCGREQQPKYLKRLLLSHDIFDVLLDLPMGLESFIFWHKKNLTHFEQALILLARALVHEPKVLIMDEFINLLSLSDQERLADFLSGLSITRILVSNDASVIAKADHHIHIDEQSGISIKS